MAYIYWIYLNEYDDITTQGYIGVTNNIEKRFITHNKRLELNSHENIHLKRAYEKYGNLEYKVLLEGSEEYSYEIEQKLRPHKDIGWNVAEGGKHPPKGYGNQYRKGKKLSEEHKQSIRDAEVFKKYNKSDHHRMIASQTMKGKPKTEEQKQKQRLAMIGKMIGDANPSKREDIRKKISIARLGTKRVYREDGTFYMVKKAA